MVWRFSDDAMVGRFVAERRFCVVDGEPYYAKITPRMGYQFATRRCASTRHVARCYQQHSSRCATCRNRRASEPSF